MLYIEQFVYTNKLRESHPLERVVFALFTMLLALVSRDWKIHALILLANILLLLFKAGIKPVVLLKLLSLPLGFLFIGISTIAVQVSNQELEYLYFWQIGGFKLGVTGGSLLLAFQTMTVSLSALSCLYFLALTSPMVEIIYVLHLFKLPDLIIELMVIIYRFIFVFLNTAMNIYYAQESRYGHSSFKKSINSFGMLFANLWSKAFFKSKALFQSLDARSYAGTIKVLNPPYKFTKKNALLFIAIDLLILIALILNY